MPNAIQLFIIAFALFITIKTVYGGMTIGILPLGWWIADTLPPFLSVIIWLLSVYIFGNLLLIQLRKYNARNTHKLPQ